MEASKDYSSIHTQLAVTQLKSQLVENIEYTEDMISLGMEGTVVVELIVSKDGFIKESSIARSLHPLFDRAALNAAKSISFVQIEQANYMGVPKVYVPILFTLTD